MAGKAWMEHLARWNQIAAGLSEVPEGVKAAALIEKILSESIAARAAEDDELIGLAEAIKESRGYTRQGLEGACTNHGDPRFPLFRRGDLPRHAAPKTKARATKAPDRGKLKLVREPAMPHEAPGVPSTFTGKRQRRRPSITVIAAD